MLPSCSASWRPRVPVFEQVSLCRGKVMMIPCDNSWRMIHEYLQQRINWASKSYFRLTQFLWKPLTCPNETNNQFQHFKSIHLFRASPTMKFYLAFCLTYYPASILTFSLTLRQAFYLTSLLTSDILSDILRDVLHSQSQAVKVWQCPPSSGARGWGPAVPEEKDERKQLW